MIQLFESILTNPQPLCLALAITAGGTTIFLIFAIKRGLSSSNGKPASNSLVGVQQAIAELKDHPGMIMVFDLDNNKHPDQNLKGVNETKLKGLIAEVLLRASAIRDAEFTPDYVKSRMNALLNALSHFLDLQQ